MGTGLKNFKSSRDVSFMGNSIHACVTRLTNSIFGLNFKKTAEMIPDYSKPLLKRWLHGYKDTCIKESANMVTIHGCEVTYVYLLN